MSERETPRTPASRLWYLHRRKLLKAAGSGVLAAGAGGVGTASAQESGSYNGPFRRTYTGKPVTAGEVETVTTGDPFRLPGDGGEGEGEEGLRQVPRESPKARGEPGGSGGPVQKQASEGNLVTEAFDGLGADDVRGVVPSDNQIAVGDEYVLHAVNSRWAVFDKSGNFEFQYTLDDWWQNVSPIIYEGEGEPEEEGDDPPAEFFEDYIIFDPRARYDAEAGRFLMLCVEYSLNTGVGAFLLSVSASGDPTGTWYNYHIPAIVGDGDEGVPGLVDFPQLGYDDDAIHLTENFFTDVFEEATMVALDKGEAYSGGTVAANHFTDLRNPGGSLAFTVQPASAEGSDTGYFVNSRFFQGKTLTVWELEDGYAAPGGGAGPTLTNDAVRVRPYHNAPPAEQPDTEEKIDPIDTRIQRVSFDGSNLWATHTVNDGRVRWYHVDPGAGGGASILHSGNFKRNGRSTYMPAVESDEAENVVLVYNTSGGNGQNGYVNAEVATVDADEIDEFEVYQAGADDYDYQDGEAGEPDNGPQVMRWGDYNGIEIDPDGAFWFTAQYAPGNEELDEPEYIRDNLYATHIGKLDPSS